MLHTRLSEWRTLLEALGELVFAGLCVRLAPFRWVARQLGARGQVAGLVAGSPARWQVTEVMWALQAIGRRTPWTSTCLMQALAAQRMLRRRNIPATVYLAMLAGRQAGNPLLAHAWVRCGDRVVTGQCDESQYRVIATFA